MKFWVAGYEDQKSPVADYPPERPATEIFESIFGKKKPATPRRVRFDKFVIRQDSYDKGEAGESAWNKESMESPKSSSQHSSNSSQGSPLPPLLPSLHSPRPTRMYSEFPHRPHIPLRSEISRDVKIKSYDRAIEMEEGKHLEHLERVAKRRFCMAVTLAILLIIGIVLAVTVPRIQQQQQQGKESQQSSATRGGHANHDTQSVPVPQAPTATKSNKQFKCIATQTELYKAVDLYLANNSSTTHVARTYGHPIGTWCFNQTLTDMTAVFSALRNEKAADFNEDLSGWDTSHVKNFGGLFQGAKSFNQALPWNTSQVYNMANIFRGASSFNSDISGWDTSKVMVFERAFQDAVSFNSDISRWSLESALSTRNMFRGATNLRQNLCRWGDSINVGADVTKMFASTPSCKINWPATPVFRSSSWHGPFCFPCRS